MNKNVVVPNQQFIKYIILSRVVLIECFIIKHDIIILFCYLSREKDIRF